MPRTRSGFVRPLVFVLAVLVATRAAAQGAAPGHPPWPTRGWSLATPESQGVSSTELARVIQVLREHKVPVHDIVIVRHGYLLLEASFFPYRKEEPHDIASVTKSITSTLVGIAIDKGAFQSIGEPIVQIFPFASDPKDPRKQEVTLANLLEMRSGLNCITNQDQGEKTLLDMLATPDWVRYTLGLPMASDPGAQFVYCSSGFHVLSGAISRATGQNERDFGETHLFEPLGIPRPDWAEDAQGRNTGWGGLQLRPTDMAKVGYLFLHHGDWDGRQIVSEAWARTATLPHPAGSSYGDGWWVGAAAAPFAFAAAGRGNQTIAVDPARDLVVAICAEISEPRDAADLKLMLGAIVSDAPLPPDPGGQESLASALSLAASPPPAHAAKPLPPAAARLSGNRLSLSANPFGLTSLTLTFDRSDTAETEITYSGTMARLLLDPSGRSATTGPRVLGLDGVPRVSRAAGHGFLVAVDGEWTSDTTFVLHYDTVAGISRLAITISVGGAGAGLTIEEPTLGIKTEVQGRFAQPGK
jgi:CubicO group peptidase (beta-lactamase class C family)